MRPGIERAISCSIACLACCPAESSQGGEQLQNGERLCRGTIQQMLSPINFACKRRGTGLGRQQVKLLAGDPNSQRDAAFLASCSALQATEILVLA